MDVLIIHVSLRSILTLVLFKEIKHLIRKEILLEFRMKYALNGILLYVVSTVFVCYLSFHNIVHPATWNSLFWIIMLFASINAVAKSFIQESTKRQLYLYTLASPQAIILSKIIYNVVLMMLLSIICFVFYSLFIGNIVQDIPMFIIALLLGSCGFSSILTLMSAIASKTNNNLALMAILSFPVQIPLLMILIKLSKSAIDGLEHSVSYQYIILLLLMNVIVVALSYILFPYLWRD